MQERLLEWKVMSEDLKLLKKKELQLRKELCNEMFDGKVGAFTETIREDGAFEAKATSKITTTLDAGTLDAVWEELPQAQRDCIAWKPSIKLRDYNKLAEGSLLSEAITQKPATPTLKVEIL